MLSAQRQYHEKFKPGMPPQIAKLVSDLFMWEEADRRLLEAVKKGQPVRDWGKFYDDLRAHYGDDD